MSDGIYAEVVTKGEEVTTHENSCYQARMKKDNQANLKPEKDQSNKIAIVVRTNCSCAGIAVGYSWCLHSFCSGDF